MRIRLQRSDRWPKPPVLGVLVVGLWLLAVGGMTLLSQLSDTVRSGCILKATTGIPCPTCGSTRLSLHMLNGRIFAAVLQNPLVWCAMAVGGAWIILAYGFKRRLTLEVTRTGRRIVWVIMIGLLLANWAYVVTIDGPFRNGVQDQVVELQEQDRGIYRFFGAPGADRPDE